MKGLKKIVGFIFAMALMISLAPMGSNAVNAATSVKNPKVTGSVANKDVQVVYDCITFGKYWQNDTNGDGTADKKDKKTAIKWRVLSVDGDVALVVADQILDVQKYNDSCSAVTWKDSTMRDWLNSTFIKNAFSSDQRKSIKSTKIANKENQKYGTKGGSSTKDKLFLLSLNDMANNKYGFTNFDVKNGNGSSLSDSVLFSLYDYAVLRTPTAFAKGWFVNGGAEGDYLSVAATETGMGCFGNGTQGEWWLRSPGMQKEYASKANSSGYVNNYGFEVNTTTLGVVPAMYIDLSNTDLWKKAGTVTCGPKVKGGVKYSK